MKIFSLRRSFTTTVILMAFSIGLPLMAQFRVRVVTPGTTFNTEGAVAPGVVQDVPGGRRFRARAGSLLKVRAVMRIPAGMCMTARNFSNEPARPRNRRPPGTS